ncbi:MAG TPA: YbhB/YbcL family Raf kinase inhibitor-like protein [Magnetospirillaceae bacterium]|nr:YbhB/YbcL family Raf kinase inhibitor-like protein [Magnetospirillaceae bacterium]
MQLTSFAFNNNDELPPRYKGNMNPPLDIRGVPEAAKSLALIMHDPDGVSGDYIHWTVWDIDPATTEILEGGAPTGSTEGITSAGIPGYVGPKPPRGSGQHHYTFELFALDRVLDLLPSTRVEDLQSEITKHQLNKATLIGVVNV